MVRTKLDAGRMAALVSRPGIDPRIWITVAVVTLVKFDPEHGFFADINVLPMGEPDTALVGSPYVTDKGGLWCPLKEGDFVIVAMPNGESDFGPTIIARVWNQQNTPAPDMESETSPTDPADGVVWRMEKGKRFKLVTENGEIWLLGENTGAITIETKGEQPVTLKSETEVIVKAPKVSIGSAPGGKQVAGVGDLVAITLPPLIAGTSPVIPATTPVPGLVSVTAVGQIVSGTESVEVGT